MSEPNQGENNEETPTPNPYEDVLAQITNTSGEPKYKTVEKALESIKPKDEFIETLTTKATELEQEVARLTEDLSKRQTTEELVNKVMENQNPQNTEETPSGEAPEINIGELVAAEIAKIQGQDQAKSNRETVATKLAETYGDKASEVLASKVGELGITPEFFKGVIDQSPAAALRLIGEDADIKPLVPAKPQGTVNPVNFNETPTPAKKSVMAGTTQDVVGLWDTLMAEAKASNT